MFEDILDFVSENDIRIKGHRIGIDDVLGYFIEGYTAEEIQVQFPTLTLKEIYAAITYYLYNRVEVDAYLARLTNWQEKRYRESLSKPSPVAERLRQLKAERESCLSFYMKIRYLLDENLPPRVKLGLQRLNSQIDVLRVGDGGAPPLETKDPEILQYLEVHQRLLVTRNRANMPAHLEKYWNDGGHLWGLFWVRSNTQAGLLIQELHFIWEATELVQVLATIPCRRGLLST